MKYSEAIDMIMGGGIAYIAHMPDCVYKFNKDGYLIRGYTGGGFFRDIDFRKVHFLTDDWIVEKSDQIFSVYVSMIDEAIKQRNLQKNKGRHDEI